MKRGTIEDAREQHGGTSTRGKREGQLGKEQEERRKMARKNEQ